MPPMPEILYGEYLVGWLRQIAKAEPVGWLEIDAWARRTGRDLDPWEAETLHRMAEAYAAQYHNSADPNCEAPWSWKRKAKKDPLLSTIDSMKENRKRGRRLRRSKVADSR